VERDILCNSIELNEDAGILWMSRWIDVNFSGLLLAVRRRRYKLICNIAHGLDYPFASDLWILKSDYE